MKRKLKQLYLIIKNNYKNYFKTNVLMFCFIFSCLINSTLLRIYTVGNTFEIKPIIADFTILLLFSSFSFLYKKPEKRIKLFMILSVILTGLCITNSIYYSYYASFASVSLLTTSTQIVNVSDAVIKDVLEFKDITFIWQPLFIYFIHIRLTKRKFYMKQKAIEKRKEYLKASLISSFILIVGIAITLTPVEINRFAKMWNREFLASKIGLYTYHLNDLIQSLQPKINNLFGYDNAVKEFNEFYQEKEKETHTENEFTNIFEGKNIIVIHAESIQTLTMDLSFNGLEMTPNLNKLANEGIFFNKFYAQVAVGNSSDSEFTFNTSLLPASSGTVFVSYFDREYVTIPKILKEKGYYSFSMHANNGTFWNRLTMHENMGYDIFYHKNYYNIDETIGFNSTALSDKSFFKQSIKYIKEISDNNQPYYGTMIMLSNHTPFDDTELFDEYPVDYKIENNGEIISRPYLEGTSMGKYFRSVHYADQAIGQFINDLDQEGLLENTVIVIYGDHDTRMPEEEYNILYNYDPINDRLLTENDEGYVDVDYYKYEMDKAVPFIIWSKDQTFNKTVNTPMGMIDVLPTLGNMFNFQSEYAMGHDILSTTSNTVVFTNGNYLTNEVYYNNQKSEFYVFDNQTISDDYIEKNNEYATKLIQVSNNIITHDLIRDKEEKEKLKEG
ncbi:MAG: LTA synthase family protein [bacterium]|nr:LTA synthase family protein [bacterium]